MSHKYVMFAMKAKIHFFIIMLLCAAGITACDSPKTIEQTQISMDSTHTPVAVLSSDDIMSGDIETPPQTPPYGINEPGLYEWPDETTEIMGMFSFGMSIADVMDILITNGLSGEGIIGTSYISSLDNMTHEELDAGEFAFIFDGTGMLYYFWTSSACTARGFTPGGTHNEMVELYGNGYIEHNDEYDYQFHRNQYICEYDFEEYHLMFNTDSDTDIVRTWVVSRYCYNR